MTDRRTFLKGLLAVGAGATIVPADSAASIPRIVGDGVHDDAPGLQAAIDGKLFMVDGQCVALRKTTGLYISNGYFFLGRPITVRNNDRPIEIERCVFSSTGNGACLVIDRTATNTTVRGCVFNHTSAILIT